MRQTNFFQTPEDERELLEHVFQGAPAGQEVVILDVSGARSDRSRGVERTPVLGNDPHSPWLAVAPGLVRQIEGERHGSIDR